MGYEKANVCTKQSFIPEVSSAPHPRFLGIAQCIYERRQEKVNIQIPLFQDENTDMNNVSKAEPYPGKIYMDAMHFGMGCSSL